MRDHTSRALLIAVVLLPVLFISGTAIYGGAVAVEGRTLDSIDFMDAAQNDFEVVFFGYVGCSYICPTSLFKIGDVLDELKSADPTLSIGGHFVDVNAEAQIQRANEYSLNFSKSIVGVNVDQEMLHGLRKEFGLNVFNTNRETDPITHTDHFFLMKKVENGWTIARVLANETNKIIIKEAIEQEINL